MHALVEVRQHPPSLLPAAYCPMRFLMATVSLISFMK